MDNNHESTETKELYMALCSVQAELPTSPTNSTNPHLKSKYSDLATIIKSSRPSLCKHGLAVIQRIVTNDDKTTFLTTRICHKSGQWIQSHVIISPPRNDIQTFGSYVTYLKRYSYASLVGVITGDDMDDDGEKAKHETKQEQPMQEKQSQPMHTIKQIDPMETINRDQLMILSQELVNEDQLLKIILSGFNIKKLADIKAKSFDNLMKYIQENKNNKVA